MGKRVTVPTAKGDLSYRQGGLPGALAAMAGGTANVPLVGPSAASDAPPMTQASIIHESLGHDKGRGAMYDLIEALKGHFTPEGQASTFWRPSEVYAYSTQPSKDERGVLDEDLKRVGVTLLDKPELMDYYLRYRNPQSDWPSTVEGFKALGLLSSDEARQRLTRR